jgi:FkbM family methyltransferase
MTQFGIGKGTKRCLRGIVLGKNAISQGLSEVVTDMRLLTHWWKGGVVFRQAAVDGFQVLLRVDESVGRAIYYGRDFESEETVFLRRHVRDADICFDIGANVGYYTVLFAKLAQHGQVNAFEPVPLNYHLLNINLLANGVKNAVASSLAVGDSDGVAQFVIAEDTAYSSLVDTGRKPQRDVIQVSMTTLDSYCLRHEIPRIDFLKVDVEGAEAKVIGGARDIFGAKDRKPRAVMLELYEPMLQKHGSSISQVVDQMYRYGYRSFICVSGRMVPFELNHHNVHYNVFFVTQG